MVYMKFKKWILDVLKGASLGMGMIPGVSAGTMGLIVGIYERLINGIASLFKSFKKSFVSLLPLGIGAIISALAITIGVRYGFHYAPVAIVSLFAGVILGFMPLITNQVKNQKKTAKPILIIILSGLFAALIGVLSALSKIYWNFDLNSSFINGDWWIYIVVFVAGFIAAAACIVPGISGSMILFIFGLYNPILNVFIGDDSMFHRHERLASGIGVFFSLLVGIIMGFVLTSKAMKSLLSKHHETTFDVVIGFVLGSIVSMYVNQEMVINEGGRLFVYETTEIWEWVVAPILLIIAFMGCYFLSKKLLNKQALGDNIPGEEKVAEEPQQPNIE